MTVMEKKNCGGTRQSSWKELIRVGELEPSKVAN